MDFILGVILGAVVTLAFKALKHHPNQTNPLQGNSGASRGSVALPSKGDKEIFSSVGYYKEES